MWQKHLTSFQFMESPVWFLTQMVSLANEVQSFHVEKKKEVSAFTKSPVIGGLSQEPSLYDILSYSYCYIGIMTGKSADEARRFAFTRPPFIFTCAVVHLHEF